MSILGFSLHARAASGVAKLSYSPVLNDLPVLQGNQATDVFTLTGNSFFQGTVALSVTGLPSGVTATWSQNPVVLAAGTGASTMTLTAGSTVVPNWYRFTVTATGGGLSLSTVYTVRVMPAVGVQVTLSNPALALGANQSATLSVTARAKNGIVVPTSASGASVSLLSGLPSGVTASWSAPTVSGLAVTWTLTLNTGSSAPPASEPVQISAQIADANSGTVYAMGASFNLLVSLLASVNVGTEPGILIPSDFMGLSHEWGDAQTMMGNATTGTNTIYRQLLGNLASYGSAPVNLRIGGNSTDSSGTPTPTVLAPFAQLAKATGSRFELGVNLGSGNVNLATTQATAYVSQMPIGSIDAIEIGNEPDWYAYNGLRPATYTVQDYFTDFYTWKQDVLSALPTGAHLMGASWAVTSTLPNTAAFEADYARDLGLFSQHFYSTSPASNPALDWLLTPAASTNGAKQVAAAVTTSHNYGLPFRIGELNSISSSGVQGISDAFGSALWSVDTMFEFANVGVDGVNWHSTSTGYYSAFYFGKKTVSGAVSYTLTSVAPLYYGMLLFQAATPNRAQLLPVGLSTAANVKSWATVDAAGTTRLVVLNKDETLQGNVSVKLSGFTQASVFRLTAPAYTSTTGITFGGQTFTGSPDGTLQGAATVETINGTNSVFTFPMSPTSAVLLVFKN